MKPREDEIQLLILATHDRVANQSFDVSILAKAIDMPPKRAIYIVEKWKRKGDMSYKCCSSHPWFEVKGLVRAKETIRSHMLFTLRVKEALHVVKNHEIEKLHRRNR